MDLNNTFAEFGSVVSNIPLVGCSEHVFYAENLAETSEQLEKFVKNFRKKRVELGFTQTDVGIALGRLYGEASSQTTICRFEAMQLSFKNMCKIKPLIQHWMDCTDMKVPEDCFVPKKRKRRLKIDVALKQLLEDAFRKQQKPNKDALEAIANELSLDKHSVRVWFGNRRQKERRLSMLIKQEACAENHRGLETTIKAEYSCGMENDRNPVTENGNL